ncbi:hypothetical protein EGT07_23750 [Herbaspirillum sp. HC18]|nr:hypothetical protein EGT07_23750 [Herbaspirillum sp. HC18]
MKNHRNVFRMAVAVMAAFLATAAMAEDVVHDRCKIYTWKPGDIIRVEAALNKQTHISLPEEALDVVWGTKDLWENDYIKNNVFFKPLTMQPQGEETTATAVGNSGNTYQFRVVRVKKLQSHCVIVNTKGSLINRASWDSKDTVAQAQIQALQQQLVRANFDKAQAVQEGQRQAREAIKSYRSSIYSKYEWSQGDGWYAGTAVESVQDDGRFTYIRLKSDNRGIMSIVAEIDGKQEILESAYDATKREYRVAGIYPKFTLRAGNSEMTITRGS